MSLKKRWILSSAITLAITLILACMTYLISKSWLAGLVVLISAGTLGVAAVWAARKLSLRIATIRRGQLHHERLLRNIAATLGRTSDLVKSVESFSRKGDLHPARMEKAAQPATDQTPKPQLTTEDLGGPLRGQWATKLRSADLAPSEKLPWLLEHELIMPQAAELVNEEFYRPPTARIPSQFKVGLVSDEFTHNSFAPEFSTYVLTPGNYEAVLKEQPLDLIIIESAWRGYPTKDAPWRGQVYASIRFNYENRKSLLKLIALASSRGVPTVFWNKEDPTHFDDRINDFVSTAARCDFILTTAEECVDGYRKFHTSDRVGVMPMAVQPRVFNPLSAPEERTREAVFAGSWYRVHEERQHVMVNVFDQILSQGVPITIYDRYFGSDNPDFEFPDKYKSFTRAAVAHETTAQIYRNALYGINFNTVDDSNTMFARRAFEMAACGTLIISSESRGMRRVFGETVEFSGPGLPPLVLSRDIEDREERRIRAMNTVLREHTYAERFERVLDLVGLPYSSFRRETTLVAFVSSEAEATEVLSRSAVLGPVVRHVVLVIHEEVPSHLVPVYYRKFVSAGVRVVSQQYWKERGIPIKTILDTPTFILVPIRHDLTQEHILRGLAHSSYAADPIRLSEQAQSPRFDIGLAKDSHLMQALALPRVLDGRFDPSPVLVV